MELHLTNLVPDEIVKALCNTLIHSLWQGVILAVVTGITIVLTKKSGAALRYNLMIGYLLLFAAVIAFTFYKQLPAAGTHVVSRVMAAAPVQYQQAEVYHQQAAEKPASIVATGIGFFNSHADTIVLIWFLIICARCVQFAAGLQNIYYLKRSKVAAAGEYWEDRVAALADNMAIKTTVRILQSGIAKLPIVIGHLKPVILIPVGLLTALSAEEVESIILHELAHVRRRDYLVNLLQNIMEIIFFFNPAVLWVSALIKAERENCCDDIVIAHTSSKVSYLKALVSCEEYRSATPAYAMGLGGKNGHLLQRVKRMLSNNNQTLNRVEKMVLTVCLITAVLITAAFSKSTIERRALKIKHKNNLVALRKTTGAGEVLINGNDTLKNRRYKIYKSREVKDGETIENTDIDKGYHLFVFKKAGTLYEYTGSGKDIDASGIYYVNGSAIPKDRVAEYMPIFEQAKIERDENTEKIKLLMQNNSESAKLYLEKLQNGENSSNADTILKLLKKTGDPDQSPDELTRLREQIAKLQQQHLMDSVRLNQSVRLGNDYNRRPVSYENGHPTTYAYYASKYKDYPEKSAKIGAELVRDNLVHDKSHFTYKLSKDEFTIDGVRQPEELHRRIVDEYFKPGDEFNINYISKDPGLDAYRSSAGNYQRQSEERQRYWDGQQRKIMDEMMRDGLIHGRNDVSFTLTTKTFVVNGIVQSGEVFQRYRHEYAPADADDNWTWNYNTQESLPATGRDWDEYSRQNAAERQRVEAERDKKLVADLLQDGLITDPNNVTFKLSDKSVTVNGKKQSDGIYNKYKDKYMPDNSGTDWTWTYSHHE